MDHFNQAGLPEPLYHRLEQIGFLTPTPIQAAAIPPALEGKDVLGSAQTGTGKTGAFGIPLVAKLLTTETGNALILLPTRELAIQVEKTLQQFIGKSRITTALLIGGDSMGKQFAQLQGRFPPRLIVGTPGRINDHLQRGSLKLDKTNFLVLDEVDRMLDMGFGIQLDAIAEYLTAERQTLMFSATMPKNIEHLTKKYLKDPVRIAMGGVDVPAAKITQESVRLKESEKFPRLLEELNKRQGSVIIFAKTKASADDMATELCRSGHTADALHGDLRQTKRSRVIEGFRKEKYRILVATDVAARGLDIPHIAHVINYNLPQCPEDYIHRIGRTARAGAEGAALNFIAPSEGGKWRAIQLLLDPNAKPDPLDRADSGGRSGGGRGRSGGGGFGKPQGRGGFGGEKRSFGGGDRDRSDRPARTGGFGDKPRGDFAPRGDRPAFGDRPARTGGFGDKPRGDFAPRSDRPAFGDRPARTGGFGDKPRSAGFGDAPRVRSGERGTGFGSRNGSGEFRGDRPKGDFAPRGASSRGGFSDKPRGDRPARSGDSRPRKEFVA